MFLPFADVMEDLYNYVNPLNDRHSPMISKETLDIILDNKDVSWNETIKNHKIYKTLQEYDIQNAVQQRIKSRNY